MSPTPYERPHAHFTYEATGLDSELTQGITLRERGTEEMQQLKGSRQSTISAQERTRKEVANLLHAQVQSRLLVLGFWLKDCQDLLKDAPSEVHERLGNARSILGEIIDADLRSITRHLYPTIIRIGLPSALESLADRFRCMLAVDIDMDWRMAEVENSVSSGLDIDLRLTLYRIVEEALTNVVKHAGADRVRIHLGFPRMPRCTSQSTTTAEGSTLNRSSLAMVSSAWKTTPRRFLGGSTWTAPLEWAARSASTFQCRTG